MVNQGLLAFVADEISVLDSDLMWYIRVSLIILVSLGSALVSSCNDSSPLSSCDTLRHPQYHIPRICERPSQ